MIDLTRKEPGRTLYMHPQNPFTPVPEGWAGWYGADEPVEPLDVDELPPAVFKHLDGYAMSLSTSGGTWRLYESYDLAVDAARRALALAQQTE